VEVTQIGKVCHNKCAIYYMAGDCIMPKEGVLPGSSRKERFAAAMKSVYCPKTRVADSSPCPAFLPL